MHLITAPRASGLHLMRRSSTIRRPSLSAAVVCALALLVASVGLSWDIRWHVWVGRDTFWTPPHALLYSGVIVAGCVCAAMSWVALREGRRPVPGYVLGTVGSAGLVIAAPFDDLWHRLYGIDVDLWTPAHLLGLVSGAIIGLGIVLVWAQLSARERAHRHWGRRTWVLLFVLAGLLTHLLTLTLPALNRYPTVELGPVRMLTLPILQTVILTAVLLGAGRLVDRPVAAAATVGLLWVRQAVESAITPPLINASVVAAGLTYRWPGGMQNLGANAPLAPLLLLPAVSAVELALWVPGLGSPAARAMIAGALVAAVQLATAPLSIGLETLAIEPLARVAPEVVGTAGAGMRALSTLPMAGPAAVCFGVFVALAVERWVHPTAVP